MTDSKLHALFVSPHLDDAIFSCGGLIAQLAEAGVCCTVLTAFTGNVDKPKGFALKCQTDKGIGASVDYMALRRAEDEAACRIIGADSLHLSHLEAPHRGYETPAALFGAKNYDDNVEQDIVRSMETILAETKPHIIFAPYGLGDHIDHRIVREVVEQLVKPLVLWQDEPYAQKQRLSLPNSVTVALSDDIYELKYRSMACYASQLNFQYGGVESIKQLMPRSEYFIDMDNQLARLLENGFSKTTLQQRVEI